MTDSLESILSGAGTSVPAPEARVDEPETLITDPVRNTIGTEQVEGQPHPDEATPEAGADPRDDRKVPLAALQEERGKVKRYTEQVADFERKLGEQNQTWERRFTEMMATMRQPVQPAEQPKPDFFENPEQAVQAAMTPLMQQFQQTIMANAQLTAAGVHGRDKVQEAETAFLQAVQAKTLDPADYQRVVNSPNRWDAAVQWHKRQTALTEIGDDPAAFRERVKAEILAEINQTGRVPTAGQPSAAGAGAVMPSNLADARNAGSRSGPVWSGPPALEDIFARK